jgi:hypothetical protein
MRQTGNVYKIWLDILKGRDYLGLLGSNVKMNLKEENGVCKLDLTGSR